MDYTQKTPTLPRGTLAANDFAAQAGGGLGAQARHTGNLSVQTANPGVGNAAATTDTVLMAFTLPAGSFDQAGRQLTLQAGGALANNANSKHVKIYVGCTTATVGQAVVGGTVIADSAPTTSANVGWQLNAQMTKSGASGSNTQQAQANPIVGSTHGGVNLPQFLTLTEGAPIIIALTGSSAASAAGDVLATLLDVSFAN